MKKHILLILLTGIVFSVAPVDAKEINLDAGDTYRQDDLTVTCGQASVETPLAINNCQHWDDFNKKCLFETTTYLYKNLECVEECQYWDKFNNSCHYQTKCNFYPAQKSFVRTTCEKFDTFNKRCERTREMRIGR
ncbi:MAG: hypothetical protein PHI06_04215 [Desulfobulbaceae bacterium]|nr:hypothetical protein [Desulfobulbaceae bacterium]